MTGTAILLAGLLVALVVGALIVLAAVYLEKADGWRQADEPGGTDPEPEVRRHG